MQTRRQSIADMEQKDFVTAFKQALNDESILEKLADAVAGPMSFQINKLSDLANDLKEQVAKFKDESKTLRQEVSHLREIVMKKESEIEGLQAKMKVIELSNDEQEQYSRRNNLRIAGLEEVEGEDIRSTVLETFNSCLKLQPPLKSENIDRIHRLGKKTTAGPRPVIVKFSGYDPRQRVFTSRTKLSKMKSDRLSRIYVNEDLTKHRAELTFKARTYRKSGSIADVWTNDGRVLIRDSAGLIHQIRSESDLLSCVA